MFKFLEKNKLYLVYLPLVIYWIILLVATSLPAPDLPDVWGSDKIKHYLAYGVLAFLLNLTFLVQEKKKLTVQKAFLVTIITCSVYGALDEIHQIFIPGRSAELLDLLADVIGAVTGAIIVLYIARKSSYNPV